MVFFSWQALRMCFLSSSLSSRSATRSPRRADFVFVGGADAARGGADLDASGGVFSAELDHAVVGKDDVGAVADEEIGGGATVSGAPDFEAGRAQHVDFLHQGEGIEHDAVADDGLGLLAEDAAGGELEDELFAGDGDGVSGVVSAGIAGDHLKAVGKHVDDFSLALIAPLGSEHHRSVRFAHSCLQAQTQTQRLRRSRTQALG